jgi:hypothetical protein
LIQVADFPSFYIAFFERLAHGFEHAALELQQFVEKSTPW